MDSLATDQDSANVGLDVLQMVVCELLLPGKSHQVVGYLCLSPVGMV